MTIAEDQTMLANVKTAINTILTGAQQFAIGDKQVSRATLSELNKMKDELEIKIQRNGGGILVTGGAISHD